MPPRREPRGSSRESGGRDAARFEASFGVGIRDLIGARIGFEQSQPHIGEVVILSTCNRVEIYAAVSGFHAAAADIGAVLAGHGRPGATQVQNP